MLQLPQTMLSSFGIHSAHGGAAIEQAIECSVAFGGRRVLQDHAGSLARRNRVTHRAIGATCKSRSDYHRAQCERPEKQTPIGNVQFH